jgi:hypothetical protein
MTYDVTQAAAETDIAYRVAGETREYLAVGIEAHYLTGPRSRWTDSTADAHIVETLAETTDPQFQELGRRFAAAGVSEDFRAGLRLAVLLIRDLDHEY